MTYVKTTWEDRIVEFPNRYLDQNLNQYTFTRNEGTITTAGTPVNASVMNKIETGIYENSVAISNMANIIYPVGSIYLSTVATNPATLFGVGTWVPFGAGRTLVGIDPSQTEFDTVEKTGGEKTNTLTVEQIPSHTHIQNSHTHIQNAHTHPLNVTDQFDPMYGGGGISGVTGSGTNSSSGSTTATNQSAVATNQNTGGGLAHNNLQPYIVTYMWKRTA